MIGAIAAGCTVVLKPSENAPNAAAIMQKIISESLDPDAFVVIQGAIPETSLLLDQKWDKIFYTGGETVGKIIAKKAAETLTPVILELGGRNPAIVTRNADARLAARRLLWAKIHNAGQVCVSQNYILIDKEILPSFLTEIKKALSEFYPDGTRNSPYYSRIATQRSFQRIKKMLDTSRGKILMGGTMDEADLFLEPTVVQVEELSDPLIVDESFGPLIPILAVDDLDQAIRIANEVHDTPLGIYPFGTKKETTKGEHISRSHVVPLYPPIQLPHNRLRADTFLPRGSSRQHPLRRRLRQRRLLPRVDPDTRLRRGGHLWPGLVPRPGLLRRLHAPAQRHVDAGLARGHARPAVPAVHGGQDEEVRRLEHAQAELRPRGEGRDELAEPAAGTRGAGGRGRGVPVGGDCAG